MAETMISAGVPLPAPAGTATLERHLPLGAVVCVAELVDDCWIQWECPEEIRGLYLRSPEPVFDARKV